MHITFILILIIQKYCKNLNDVGKPYKCNIKIITGNQPHGEGGPLEEGVDTAAKANGHQPDHRQPFVQSGQVNT